MVAGVVGNEMSSFKDTLAAMPESQYALTAALSSLAAKQSPAKNVTISAAVATPAVPGDDFETLMGHAKSSALKLKGILRPKA